MNEEMTSKGGEGKSRKRGAPRGNKNALKHGFYSRHFKAGETSDLEHTEQDNLDSEINMLRVVIRRTMEIADGQTDLEAAVKILGSLGAAATRLSSLLRTQKLLNTGQSTAYDQVTAAIAEVSQELFSKKY
ncbi:MAG: hypothetical protein JW726_15115 [Anaerolineales bacterium]|nr:hypothetical protein [Anaerolineales bacterium]